MSPPLAAAYSAAADLPSMQSLRHSRRLGRLLAVWLLLWFVAMAATRVLPPAGADQARLVAAASAHADHQGHHQGHVADEPAQGEAEVAVGLHAGHASGSVSHCPLCTHGAAPPPPQFAALPAGAAPIDHPGAQRAAPVRVRTDAPPPARGPPLLS